MKFQLDSCYAKRDFGKRRISRLQKICEILEAAEKKHGRRITSVALVSGPQNCTWNRHLGYKTYMCMASVFVDEMISASRGYSVRFFTEDVEGGRGFRKPQIAEAVISELEKIAKTK
jgi:hypothetical protein